MISRDEILKKNKINIRISVKKKKRNKKKNTIHSDRFQTASMIHFISVFGFVFDVFS